MGTQPEEIEHALRGKRTLPKPGEPKELQGREGEGKTTSGAPDERGALPLDEGVRGEQGEVLSEGEERRFNVRGGRWNAASKDER